MALSAGCNAATLARSWRRANEWRSGSKPWAITKVTSGSGARSNPRGRVADDPWEDLRGRAPHRGAGERLAVRGPRQEVEVGEARRPAPPGAGPPRTCRTTACRTSPERRAHRLRPHGAGGVRRAGRRRPGRDPAGVLRPGAGVPRGAHAARRDDVGGARGALRRDRRERRRGGAVGVRGRQVLARPGGRGEGAGDRRHRPLHPLRAERHRGALRRHRPAGHPPTWCSPRRTDARPANDDASPAAVLAAGLVLVPGTVGLQLLRRRGVGDFPPLRSGPGCVRSRQRYRRCQLRRVPTARFDATDVHHDRDPGGFLPPGSRPFGRASLT